MSAGTEARVIGPSSTCGDGAPSDVNLACGIPVAHPRAPALPVRPGEPIVFAFKAGVGRLLVERKRATGKTGPVEELRQLAPVPAPKDLERWTVQAPQRIARGTVLGVVALYRDPVRIRRLSNGSTVPIHNAVVQFQIALTPAE